MSFDSTNNPEIDDNPSRLFTPTNTSHKRILKEFKSHKTKGKLKRDNFNIHIMRTMKKMINCLIAGKKPNCKAFIQYDVNDPEMNKIWREIDAIYYDKIDYFVEKSEIKLDKVTYRSMGLEFSKAFFRGHPIKNFYHLTIDLLFYYSHKEKLSTNLCICCCDGNHQENCDMKWQKLREYMKLHYLNDLKVN